MSAVRSSKHSHQRFQTTFRPRVTRAFVRGNPKTKNDVCLFTNEKMESIGLLAEGDSAATDELVPAEHVVSQRHDKRLPTTISGELGSGGGCGGG